MTMRVALVASTTADVTGDMLAARLGHLLANGWDARLLCNGARWRQDPALHEPGLRRHVTLDPDGGPRSSPFDRLLRRLRPDLVHFHSGWAAWKAMHRGQLPDTRVVISFRDDGQDLRVPDPRFLWKRSDLLLFGHRAALERAAAQGWPLDRAEILHPPVPAVAEQNAPSSDAGVLRILSAGSLIWEQGFEHSVQAVRLLLDAGVRCSYRIIGEGDHAAAVAFARHQLALVDDVEILAPLGGDRLAQELRLADVFVDPAVADTTSPVALDAAQMYGLPVVITTRRNRALAGTGIEVPRRNPRALADALAILAAQPDLRTQMGLQGRRTQSSATLPDHLTRLESLYRAVIA